MRPEVDYLVRNPYPWGGLVYPTELEERDYYTTGSFFLMSRFEDDFRKMRFQFRAISRGRVIMTELTPIEEAENFFRVKVDNVGTFIFNAEIIPGRTLRYTGNREELAGHRVVARLRSWQLGQLEATCIKNDFYFSGFSPAMLDLNESA